MLERINLIVFDECHRAVSNHPMRQIMQQFKFCSKDQPRVLAMSATLLNANIKADKIESTIRVKNPSPLFCYLVIFMIFRNLKIHISYRNWK